MKNFIVDTYSNVYCLVLGGRKKAEESHYFTSYSCQVSCHYAIATSVNGMFKYCITILNVMKPDSKFPF